METSDKMGETLRDQFADFAPEPTPAVWKGVESRLKAEKPKRKVLPWIFAAAATVTLVIALVWWMGEETPMETPQLAEETTAPAPSAEEHPQPQAPNDLAIAAPEQEPPAPVVELQTPPANEPIVQRSHPRKPSVPQELVPAPQPDAPRRKPLNLRTLDPQPVGMASATLPTRVVNTPSPSPSLDPLEDPAESEAVVNLERIGQFVNAGNALFNLPVGYKKEESEGQTDEKLEANFAFFQIRKHTTYRQ